MNEIVDITNDVSLQVGIVNFNSYDKYLTKVNEIAEIIKSQEVTEENLKESKKLVAEARKIIDRLNDRRIGIKKELLKPYDDFENKIKTLTNIIKEADDVVRQEIRKLEEKEKEDKKDLLEELWNKRIIQYKYMILIEFKDWLESDSKLLNKTISINKCEEHMTEWLEQRKKDLELIQSVFDNKVDMTQTALEYSNNDFNVTDAISYYKKQKARKEELLNKCDEKEYIFIIKSEKDCKLVELLLKENKIKFNMEVR